MLCRYIIEGVRGESWIGKAQKWEYLRQVGSASHGESTLIYRKNGEL